MSRLKQYFELTKPGVVSLILFTALVGMLLSMRNFPTSEWVVILWGLLGIALSAGGAAAINHWADQKADKVMLRTQHRPLPSGGLKTVNVLTFAAILSILGTGILVYFVNVLTAVLTFVSLIGYAFIYTMFLKRVTPQNIVIGGLAGATPPVLGWTTVTGHVTPDALLLLAIIYVWTPPHFWALAIFRKEDYKKAHIPMLPVTHGVKFTELHIIFYTILLFIVTLFPFLTGMSGLIYLAGAVILGIRFLWMTFKLKHTRSPLLAWNTFKYSIWYLMLLFAFLLLDHYVLWGDVMPRLFSEPVV
ncbi:protoheme IX farnesyltransferase [Marinicella pacifica]|jgi:protoheme IX farnesyltransferase|uniref:Protoheme IX farnesyltransferase n=1 Tax=Marinicella pacifica TaxID=1171543 RepID=A0A917CQ57_9GAMM|nr:heme o synthase [Marinicella pacifica]GGF93474.1 protoheme IX farnesyltransferase [Marinicella pacifica]